MFFFTQYDDRKALNRNVFKSIKDELNTLVFDTKIRDNVVLAEAPKYKKDIFRHSSNSNGAQDYLDLSNEILKKTSRKETKSEKDKKKAITLKLEPILKNKINKIAYNERIPIQDVIDEAIRKHIFRYENENGEIIL